MRRLLTISSLLFVGMLACLAEHERDLRAPHPGRDSARLTVIEQVVPSPIWPSLYEILRIPAPAHPAPPACADHLAALHRHLLQRRAALARQRLRATSVERAGHAPRRTIVRRRAVPPSSCEDDPLLLT